MFVNSNLNNLLNTQGYVIISLLNKQEVQHITDLYRNVPSGVDGLFYTSIWSKDEQYRKNVNAFLKKLIAEKFENIFTDFKPIFGNLIIKKPGAASSIELHQDWTLVNESKYKAVNIWCPLNDTNADNGCLQVIRGSHSFFNVLRGRLMYNPLQNISHLLKQRYLKQLVLNAGDCVVFDTRLLHASADNVTDKERLAFSVTATYREAQLCHYVGNNGTSGIMKELSIDESFFENYSIEKADFKEGDLGVTAVKEHPFNVEDVSITAFEEKMKLNPY